jgi:hypothetical protein
MAGPAYNRADGGGRPDGSGRELVSRLLGLRLLAPGLLGFWALYFAIVALSNLTDLLRELQVLPASWRWVSGNLAFIAASTGRFAVPAWVNPILLAGVIAWEALAALLFWRAAWHPIGRRLGPAFAVSLSLWGAFILLDEILLIFETGAEATHFRLLIATLLTLLVVRLGWSASEPTQS